MWISFCIRKAVYIGFGIALFVTATAVLSQLLYRRP